MDMNRRSFITAITSVFVVKPRSVHHAAPVLAPDIPSPISVCDLIQSRMDAATAAMTEAAFLNEINQGKYISGGGIWLQEPFHYSDAMDATRSVSQFGLDRYFGG